MANSRRPNNSKPPGGKRRADHERELIYDRVRYLMEHNSSKREIARIMSSEMRVPSRTVDLYMARVRGDWAAESAAARPTLAARSRSRQYRRLRRLEGIAADNKLEHQTRLMADREAIKQEHVIGQMEGTLAPEQLEIVRRVGWQDLTPEQYDYVIKHGRPPPGVSVEQLFAQK